VLNKGYVEDLNEPKALSRQSPEAFSGFVLEMIRRDEHHERSNRQEIRLLKPRKDLWHASPRAWSRRRRAAIGRTNRDSNPSQAQEAIDAQDEKLGTKEEGVDFTPVKERPAGDAILA
jgi:hypothetical protein